MKSRFWTMIVALLLLPHLVQAADDDVLDQDFAKIRKAFIDHDYETIVDMMYAPVVAAGGGRNAVVGQAEAVAAQGHLESFDAVKPYTRIHGSKNDYAVIPTHTILEVNGQRYEMLSYQLAVRPRGQSVWQYVDGSGLNPQFRKLFFSDLPEEAKLPSCVINPLDSPAPPPAQNSAASTTVTQVEKTGPSPSPENEQVGTWTLVGIIAILCLITGSILVMMTRSASPESRLPPTPVERAPPRK